VAEYRTALRLAPKDADTHYDLMQVFIAQKNAEAAAKELDEFIRLATNTAANRQKIDEAKKRIGQLGGVGK
jgi:thioredoxin-like negative regulator of GroEL